MRVRWSLVMFAAMFVGLAVAGLLYTAKVQRQFACVARYNTALQERSQILTRIAAEDREQSQAAEQATARLITDAIAADGDAAAGSAAAQRYLRTVAEIAAKRRELEKQRAAHPFPQTPEKACT